MNKMKQNQHFILELKKNSCMIPPPLPPLIGKIQLINYIEIEVVTPFKKMCIEMNKNE